MRAPLTPKQKEIYDSITAYIANHKKAPYIREIQEACRINSYKSVVDKLLSLEKKGYIKRRLNKHRSIKLVNPGPAGESEANPLMFEHEQSPARDGGGSREKKMEVQT